MEKTALQNIQEPVPQDDLSGAWTAARALACGAALAALGASLWAALGIANCEACRGGSGLVPGIPVAWLGVAFYTLLASAIASRTHSRWATPAFFSALGVHAVLLVVMARQGRFCAPCAAAGAAAFLGAVISVTARPRPRMGFAAGFFLATVIATSGGVMAIRAFQNGRETGLPLIVEIEQAAVPTARIKVLLYEREGCGHCLDFEQNVMPGLQQAIGTQVEFERLDPPIDMETPTLVVEGKTNRTFAGTIDEKEVENAVHELQ